MTERVHAMEAAARGSNGRVAPEDPVSSERIRFVIALDDDPARRNMLITQCYHDLSDALGRALGLENANWCTFAKWASRTAGGFIREDEVPARFKLALGQSEPFGITLARVNDALTRARTTGLDADRALRAIGEVVNDVARMIAAGNLAVFGELGPVFSRAISALAADPGPDALGAVEESLTPGASEDGGQSLLRDALRRYALARAEPDQCRKAALMLLANAEVGLHEQIRLQPFIAGALDAPVRDSLYSLAGEASRHLSEARRHEVHVVVNRLLRPIGDSVYSAWERFATYELMTLSLPDGKLTLGRGIPAPPGAPVHPPVLDPIVIPEVMDFLLQYDADNVAPHRAGAVDWARLSDRMRVILGLFRSRQCDRALFEPPFTPREHAMILAGEPVPRASWA